MNAPLNKCYSNVTLCLLDVEIDNWELTLSDSGVCHLRAEILLNLFNSHSIYLVL